MGKRSGSASSFRPCINHPFGSGSHVFFIHPSREPWLAPQLWLTFMDRLFANPALRWLVWVWGSRWQFGKGRGRPQWRETWKASVYYFVHCGAIVYDYVPIGSPTSATWSPEPNFLKLPHIKPFPKFPNISKTLYYLRFYFRVSNQFRVVGVLMELCLESSFVFRIRLAHYISNFNLPYALRF